MPRIKLTPEEMKQESQALHRSEADNRAAISTLNQIVNGLLSQWHGEAQQAFVNSYNAKRRAFDAFTNDICALARFVDSFSGKMADAEKEKTIQARNL